MLKCKHHPLYTHPNGKKATCDDCGLEFRDEPCEHDQLDETGKDVKCMDCGKKVYWDPVENVVYAEGEE
ncbi:MAG: hypothetical protein ACE5H1_01240 [Thermodesulfobacteriota bacterium]